MTATFLLLILFFLTYSACKPRIVLDPIYIGEARIVGKIISGTMVFEPGEDPQKTYYIVMPAFLLKAAELAMENAELKLTIKKLREIIEKEK